MLPTDCAAILNQIQNSKSFFETPTEDEKAQDKTPAPVAAEDAANMDFLFQEWAQFHAEGQLILRPNRYWTRGGSFWRLPAEAPELHEDLKPAELIIFKGDLNYRKLTGDVSTPLDDIYMIIVADQSSFLGSLGYHHTFRGGPWPHGP